MANYSYITVLSTEEYLEGVLALALSLQRTGTKYPLTVLITDAISSQTEELLMHSNLNVIRKNKIHIPESISLKNQQGTFSRWSNTFDKLLIFELTEFDKLVCLDSDMYIRKNIDELFEKNHLSATIDRRYGPSIDENWTKLTSGLMVIEPRQNVLPKLIDLISEMQEKKQYLGDQDILQAYDPNWDTKTELHLDLKYNMFFSHIDYYTHFGNYSLDDICVVHFIYRKKPFSLTRNQIPEYMDYIEEIKKSNDEKYQLKFIKDWIQCGNQDEKKILQEYFSILEEIRQK